MRLGHDSRRAHAGPSEESVLRLKAAIQEKRKRDREDAIELAKLIVESRSRKNIDLELMELQNKKMMEDTCTLLNRKN